TMEGQLLAVRYLFFFSSRRRHTRFSRDWSSDVCSSDLASSSTRAVPVSERAFTTSTSSPRSRKRPRVPWFATCRSLCQWIQASKIGRASCRERVKVSVGALSFEERNRVEHAEV